MRGAKPEYRASSRRPVLSPLFYQDDQIFFFPPPCDARKWLRKYVRGKRGKRGKSSSLPFYPSHAPKEKGELQKNVIVVFDPDYQCFVAVAEPFFGARWAAA
jgi:hypothetical protein